MPMLPAYARVYNHLKNEIVKEVYAPGDFFLQSPSFAKDLE